MAIFFLGAVAGVAFSAVFFIAGGAFATRSFLNSPAGREQLMKRAAEEIAKQYSRTGTFVVHRKGSFN